MDLTDLANLQRGYRNPSSDLLRVYNCIFNPAVEAYSMPFPSQPHCHFLLRPQTTLQEWEQLLARELPRTEVDQKRVFGMLTFRTDFRFERIVGGEGRYRRVEWDEGPFGWVDDFIAGAGRRCGVCLEWRDDMNL